MLAVKVFLSVVIIMILKTLLRNIMILKTLLLTNIFFFSCIGISRDGERIDLGNYAHCLETDCICKSASENLSWDAQTSRTSKVTLQLRRGLYHDCYHEIAKVSFFFAVVIDRHPYTHTQTYVKLNILHLSCLSKTCHLGMLVA